MKLIAPFLVLILAGCATQSVIPQFVMPDTPAVLLEPSKDLQPIKKPDAPKKDN